MVKRQGFKLNFLRFSFTYITKYLNFNKIKSSEKFKPMNNPT